MTNQEDQWLLEGNCNICRRKNYCHKYCKARSESIEKGVKNTLSNILIKRFFGG